MYYAHVREDPTSPKESTEAMRMHVDFLAEKGEDIMSEDAFFIGRRRFGVFDGATSLDGYVDERGNTGGYLAANLAKDVFETSEVSLLDTALKANMKIAEVMREKGIGTSFKESLWGTALAVVEVDPKGKGFEWVQISDSLILLIHKDRSHRMIVPDFVDQDQDIYVHWKKLVEQGVENVRERLQDEIIQHRRDANITYGVLDGEENAKSFLKSGRESLEGVTHILMFTDGLFIPKEDRREPHDFSLLVKLFLEGGLENIKRYVRGIEESDPECMRYVRSKKSDDMTAIAISFEGQ